MALNYVLDTNVLLYHLGGKLAVPLPSGGLHVSVISEIELLSYPGLTSTDESAIESFLSTLTLIDLTSAIKRQAIFLRRTTRLKLPDAVVVATAVALNSVLLTNDADLLKLPMVQAQSLAII